MFKIGQVEKKIFELREEGPLIIPQLDPDKLSIEAQVNLLDKFDRMGVRHIAVGSSLQNPEFTQNLFDIIIKDYDFTVTTYISNTGSFLLKGKEGRSAIYWATVFNATNLFFLKDSLVMGAGIINTSLLEPIPTAYVFDDRESKGTSNWLTQPNLIPRNKPEISLANALACQYLGVRFYIMAGGSGSKLPPSAEHVKLLSKKTSLFLIPTSGIKTIDTVKELLSAGADALHISSLIESNDGFGIFEKIFDLSKKFPGKKFC